MGNKDPKTEKDSLGFMEKHARVIGLIVLLVSLFDSVGVWYVMRWRVERLEKDQQEHVARFNEAMKLWQSDHDLLVEIRTTLKHIEEKQSRTPRTAALDL